MVNFDLNQARDIGTPGNLGGALGEFAGKIQQTCNGKLINVAYELHIIAEVDGCLCCTPHPYVYTPIEILAPERVLVFQQEIYVPVPAGYDQAPQGLPPPGAQVIAPAPYSQAPAPNGQVPVAGQPQHPQVVATIAGPSDYVNGGMAPVYNPEAPVKGKEVEASEDV